MIIEPGDVLQINTEGESIIIKKAEKKCIFCNGEDELREFEGKTVCAGCLERLRALS